MRNENRELELQEIREMANEQEKKFQELVRKNKETKKKIKQHDAQRIRKSILASKALRDLIMPSALRKSQLTTSLSQEENLARASKVRVFRGGS